MNYRDLTLLLIKLTGTFLIIYSIVGIPAYVTYYFALRLPEVSALIFFSVSIFPFLVPFLVGIGMFKFPGLITNKVIFEKNTNDENTFSGVELQLVAFRTLGLYLLFRVISDFSYHFSYIFLTASDTGDVNPFMIDTDARIFATFMELFFALFLLFGAKSIAKIIFSIRAIGTK